MTSQPKQPDLDQEHQQELSSSVEDDNSTLTEDLLLEEKTESSEKSSVRIEIPEPDADNITVLTHKLPNKPILPWNHYDSPWEDNETEMSSDDCQASDNLTVKGETSAAPSSDVINNQES